MPTKMFLSYRLKPETDVSEFKKWSVEVDMPFTAGLDGVEKFVVYEAEGDDVAAEGLGPLFFEDIEVESREKWDEVLGTPEGQEMVATWKSFADESSLTLFHGPAVVAA
ncbi:MAG: hypothetical protein JHC95_09525 [Solirubrobacteraceae bacterium]|nr:hypothetical protein [Solirubrobacteraceae bacterium]